MRPNDIVLAVSQLTDLNSLNRITEAVADRKRSLAKIAAADYRPGDKVSFSNTIRPRYLAGLPVEIINCNRESVTVKVPLDKRYGRFSGSGHCRLPLALIGGKVSA